MFEELINNINSFYQQRLASVGRFISLEQLSKINLHPALLKYINAEVNFLIFEDRNKLLKNSAFDYSSEKILYYFGLISEEIKKNKKFSIDFISRLIKHAITFNVHYLARPNWTLTKFIFEDNDTKTESELRYLLNYPYFYPLIIKVITKYFRKKNISSMNIRDFEDLLRKIDSIAVEDRKEELFNKTIESMSDFFGLEGTNPKPILIKMVKYFLMEKGLTDYYDLLANKFPEEDQFLSPGELLGVVNVKKLPNAEIIEQDKTDASETTILKKETENAFDENGKVNPEAEDLPPEEQKHLVDELEIKEKPEGVAKEELENKDFLQDEQQINKPEQGTEIHFELSKTQKENLNKLVDLDSDNTEPNMEEDKEVEEETSNFVDEQTSENPSENTEPPIAEFTTGPISENDSDNEIKTEQNVSDILEEKEGKLTETPENIEQAQTGLNNNEKILPTNEEKQEEEKVDSEESAIVDKEELEREKITDEDKAQTDKLKIENEENNTNEDELEIIEEEITDEEITLENVEEDESGESLLESSNVNERAKEESKSEEEIPSLFQEDAPEETEDLNEFDETAPEKKLNENSEETKNPVSKIDLTKLLNNKKAAKIIEEIFDYDMEEFSFAIDIIGEATTKNEALEKLKIVFEKYSIAPDSKEGQMFKEIIIEYFENS